MISSIQGEFARYERLLKQAVQQIDDDAFFAPLREGQNSVAVLVKHLGGNLISRFTDFRTSDGEKEWRNRDSEFIVQATRDDVMELFAKGYAILSSELAALNDSDIHAFVTIRGQQLTISDALCRSLAHMSYHVGEIVQLCRYHKGDDWEYLSIPPNQSDAYNANPTLEKPSRK